MVTPEPERRSWPEYALTRIGELARSGCVVYIGGTESDAASINYELDDIQDCLCCLTEQHYEQSIRYDPKGRWRDVYHIDHLGPDGVQRPLYIKLHLDRSCLYIYLNSFHPRRY
jgi:hypothetical protein